MPIVPPSSRVPPVKATFDEPAKLVFFKLSLLLFVMLTPAASVTDESYSFNSPPEICVAELNRAEPPVSSILELSSETFPMNVNAPELDSISASFLSSIRALVCIV